MTRDELLQAAREALRETVAQDVASTVEPLLELPPVGDTTASHTTIAEVTLVTSIETMFRAHLGERAADAIARFATKRALSRTYQTFLFGTMSNDDRVDGKGACRQRLAPACPACQRENCVDYIGSDILGDLEWVHVMHCEADDWFVCSECGYSWSEHHHI